MTDRYSDYFMDVAKRTAELSYANRLKVGAVAVRDRRIVCVGFNGQPPNVNNTCEGPDGLTLPTVIHAESNLIRFAKSRKIDLIDCSLYITHSPCINCAEEIWANYIKEVIYDIEYRCNAGIEFLKDKNITIRKYNA